MSAGQISQKSRVSIDHWSSCTKLECSWYADKSDECHNNQQKFLCFPNEVQQCAGGNFAIDYLLQTGGWQQNYIADH